MAAGPQADPNRLIEQILAQAPYRPASVPVGDNPWVSGWMWLLERLAALMRLIRTAVHGSPAGEVALGVACLAIAGLAFGYVAFRLVVRSARRRSPRVACRPLLALGHESAGALLQRASDLVRRQRCREAAAALYLAALYGLDEAQIVPYVPARTVAEYRAALADAPPRVAAAFEASSGLFTRAAFAGETPPTPALVEAIDAWRACGVDEGADAA